MLKTKKRAASNALKDGTPKKLATYPFQIIGLEPTDIAWTVETHTAATQNNVVERYLRSQLTPGLESMEKVTWRQRSDKMAAYEHQTFVVVVLDVSKHLEGFAQTASVCSFYHTSVLEKTLQPDTPDGLPESYYGFAKPSRLSKLSSNILTGNVLEMSALLETEMFQKKCRSLNLLPMQKLIVEDTKEAKSKPKSRV